MSNNVKNYNNFVVYDLRTAFNKAPGNICFCPFCKNSLLRSKCAPSLVVDEDMQQDSLIPIYDTTDIFACANCGWWYVRERWSLNELQYANYDYLITGIQHRWHIADVLLPLMEISTFIQDDQQPSWLLHKEIKHQEQVITLAMNQFWQHVDIHYIGSGVANCNDVNLYAVQKLDESFFVVVKQSTTGWITFEVVELVNGSVSSNDSNREIYLTSRRQLDRHGKIVKAKICKVVLKHTTLFDSLVCKNTNKDDVLWETLSKVPNLYDDLRKLPAFMVDAFQTVLV